jgi:hypothetical protein
MWCIRELSSGLPWRRGWLCHQAQPPCAACLAPRQPLAWPLRAVLSDQHPGWGPAVAAGVPPTPPQCGPAHSLRPLADPLAAAAAACTLARRQSVRQQGGVLTGTGLVPRP